MDQDSKDKDAPKKALSWPILKWSADEKYFARIVPGQAISVYTAPSMRLLDNKSIKIDGVVDFEWAPLNDAELAEVEDEIRGGKLVEETEKEKEAKAKKAKKPRENMLAYWLPEQQNQPARVALMAVPSRETIRTKNLFNVADVSLCNSICKPRSSQLIHDFYSANCTGRAAETTCVSRSTVSQRQRRPHTAISKSSEYARKLFPSRSSR